MVVTPTVDQLLGDDIFSLLGLENISLDEKAEFIAKFSDTLQYRVLTAIVSRLSRGEQEELDQLPADQMLGYIENKKINAEDLIVQEALNYRLELLSTFNLMTAPLAV